MNEDNLHDDVDVDLLPDQGGHNTGFNCSNVPDDDFLDPRSHIFDVKVLLREDADKLLDPVG